MTLFRWTLPLLLIGFAFQALAETDITATVMPNFPSKLDYEGYRSGDADVAIEVDAQGRMVDCLVTACTRREFGEESLKAVRQWKYHAGLVNGQPGGWVRHVTIHFETDGVRIVQDNLSITEEFLAMRTGRESGMLYRAYSPKELDQIPPFTHFVAPQGSHAGVVTVEFYVDEKGAVRLPAIRDSKDDDLDNAALTAVSQWHFDPPMRHGSPVLLKVTQDLHFVDKKG